ncbi:MAG: ABC transporter ATP-binding protein [Betaproteobacteria bacterium]|nr:ABC transporter ATP-binding protein [Betaproteobacteria bacterium]
MEPTDAGPLLELQLPLLSAGGRELVRELRLRVERGQRWAVIGRNGAGKSTLLRLLAGLQLPPGARVQLGGEAMQRMHPARLARWRAYMPAVPHDRFGLAVLDAVMLGQLQPEAARALHELERVDARGLAPRSLLGLSAGERQRVALAQVLAQDTSLLLLDEPVSFQDPRHHAALAGLLREHVREGTPRALVFSAHDLNWVASLATHVLALLPDAAWAGGTASQVLRADVLEAVYGCPWQRIERAGRADLWVPAD